MNKIFTRRNSLIIFIAWLFIIYFLSDMPGEDSGALSSILVLFLSKLFLSKNSVEFVLKYGLFVRKLAHVTEFFIATLLAMNYFRFAYKKSGMICLFSGGFVFLYSISDEIHQYFVSGRGCSYIDVLIDSIGIVFALVLYIVITKHASKRKSS